MYKIYIKKWKKKREIKNVRMFEYVKISVKNMFNL